MEFHCRVATATGQVTEATYVAESEERLRHDLEAKGLFLLSVRGGGVSVGKLRLAFPQRRRLPSTQFTIFNQELATLLKAGLPLVQALDILRKRASHAVLRAALDDVHRRVRSGSSLSEAFAAQGDLVSGVYIASLMAGEKSGSLEQVIRRYVQHVKVIAAAKSQVISALIYPAVLVVLSFVVVGIIVFQVVPEFADFYAQFDNAALPYSTQVVVAISTNLVASAGAISLIAAGIAAALVFWYRRPGQRVRIDAAVLRIPYFGPLARRVATAQVARTLATLLTGGIPLVNALEVAATSSGNRAIARHLTVVAAQVREGSSLSDALARGGMFPTVAVEMVEVGESTGALAEMLNSTADFYDEDNQTSLTRFSNLVQPVLLIVMGAVIAGLMLSLYMPLFRLSTLTS